MADSARRTPDSVGVHVALLRGINVGGKNMLPMKNLIAMFADAGCSAVRTYIQSGNVVFEARQDLANTIPALIAAAISDRFGARVPVITRTAAELREVARSNPFLRAGVDTGTLHVMFLANSPEAGKVASLDPNRSSTDEFVVRGREVYLRCPNGLARTKLTNEYFDSKLATTSTVRNWRTVLKLLQLTGPD